MNETVLFLFCQNENIKTTTNSINTSEFNIKLYIRTK